MRTRHSNVVTVDRLANCPIGYSSRGADFQTSGCRRFSRFCQSERRITNHGRRWRGKRWQHPTCGYCCPPLVCSSSDLLLLSSFPLHHHHTLNPFGFYIQLLSCEPGMHLLPFKSHRLPPDLRALPSPSSRIKCGSEMNLTHAVVP